MKNIKRKQAGFSHVELLVVIVLVGAIGFGAWRVMSSDDTVDNSQASISTQESLPENLTSLKSLEEIEQIAGVDDSQQLISFVLESKDGLFVYDIILSNGKKLSIDASTGDILSEEVTDISDDDKLPGGFVLGVSPAQAYEIASRQSNSGVKSIEMEVEDDKVTYKVELQDGSKIEIDAGTGNIIKSEVKDEDEDEDEREDEDEHEDESEHEHEDDEDEDDEHEHEESEHEDDEDEDEHEEDEEDEDDEKEDN